MLVATVVITACGRYRFDRTTIGARARISMSVGYESEQTDEWQIRHDDLIVELC